MANTNGQKPSSVATLRRSAPSVEAAFMQLRAAIEHESSLDRKMRELIVLAGYVTARQEKGFKTHARRALDAGASAADVKTAALVTLGATATVEAVGTALQWLDEIVAGGAASVVPATSSGTAGPLGAIHLPRLWEKLTLAAAGALPGDYDECGAGFDQMTLDALKLDKHETIAFVRSKKPTYVQFEAWVLARNGGRIDEAVIRNHNTAILAYHHSGELAAKMRTTLGVPNAAICDAVTLNLLEDLDELHRQVVK